MKNRILWAFLGGLAIAGAVFAATSVRYGERYARDRAEIDDLLSRYLFALDWQDPQQYASLFTEDGVLVWLGGTVNGRKAIVAEMTKARAADVASNAATPGLRPFRRRHFASNFVLRIDGNRATVRTYWFEFNNDNAERRPYLGAYGHLEDDLRRVDDQWLIARHQVFNEQREQMAAGALNPAW
jgi:SnoaL-like domain